MERNSEERSVISESKRDSVHSDWSDLIPIDVEAEYHGIHNIRKGSYESHASHMPSAAPVATDPVPPSSPAGMHKAVKNIVLVLYTPSQINREVGK